MAGPGLHLREREGNTDLRVEKICYSFKKVGLFINVMLDSMRGGLVREVWEKWRGPDYI